MHEVMSYSVKAPVLHEILAFGGKEISPRIQRKSSEGLIGDDTVSLICNPMVGVIFNIGIICRIALQTLLGPMY